LYSQEQHLQQQRKSHQRKRKLEMSALALDYPQKVVVQKELIFAA
jgi:hypothetical protein